MSLVESTKLMSYAQDNVKYFHSSKYISDLANGDVCVAIGYNGGGGGGIFCNRRVVRKKRVKVLISNLSFLRKAPGVV